MAQEGQAQPTRLIIHKKDKGEKAKEHDVKPPLYIKRLVLTDVEGAPEAPAGKQNEPADEKPAKTEDSTDPAAGTEKE